MYNNYFIKERRICTFLMSLQRTWSSFQTTDEEALRKALWKCQLYSGYDPATDNILVALYQSLVMKHLQLAGHKPMLSLAGATGLIGDPSFKDTERSYEAKRHSWRLGAEHSSTSIAFLDFENGDSKAEMVSNYDWFSAVAHWLSTWCWKIFHYQYAQWVRIRKLVETGISYTGFCLPDWQGYDFLS